MAVQIQLRRGTAAAWTSANPTLAVGELVIETDTDFYKIGDGSTAWTSLGYSSLPSTAISNTVVDAKGDIIAATADNTVAKLTVGSNGQVLTAASGQGTGLQWATMTHTAITVADTTDTTCFVGLFESATGDLAPKTDAGVTYNAGTGMLTATGFTGPLTGNVTGNTSGTSGSTTGNAATATALATGRTIGGVSFDGTANIAVTLAATSTALATARDIGGTSFDGTANIAVALAATSTALATGRTINGVSFDGTANITVVDSAALPLAGGTMTGTLVGLVAPLTINPQAGTTYTFVLADAGKLVTSSNTSAQTFTVPPTLSPDFPVGTQIMVQNINTANCTLAQGSGVTITSKDSNKEIDGRYAAATLIKTATNAWTLIGALK
jgi:hypothetical protein